jgi:hypothetical protein
MFFRSLCLQNDQIFAEQVYYLLQTIPMLNYFVFEHYHAKYTYRFPIALNQLVVVSIFPSREFQPC